MENRTWNFMDKSGFPKGEWNREPDKVQWQDPETGLPCLIVRNHFGALCGYVGVPEDHPYFGKDYDDCDVSVHGGLTFAGSCNPGVGDEGICHVVSEGENDKVWWLGFDCAHYQDITPRMLSFSAHSTQFETYKNIAYVRAECRDLASQLRPSQMAERERRFDLEAY